MTKCYQCGGETKPQEVNWTVSVGGDEVIHLVTADVCRECGEWTLSAQELERLELQSALDILRANALTGAILKDVRKTLGLKQTQLGEQLGVAWETVSRWEGDKRAMEPWVKVALRGLVLEALQSHQRQRLAELNVKRTNLFELLMAAMAVDEVGTVGGRGIAIGAGGGRQSSGNQSGGGGGGYFPAIGGVGVESNGEPQRFAELGSKREDLSRELKQYDAEFQATMAAFGGR